MSKVVFLTRGDERWGLGHLHRTSWLVTALDSQRQPGLRIEIICLDSIPARRFWASRNSPVAFIDGATFAQRQEASALPCEVGSGDTVVIDWLDSSPQLISDLRNRGVRVALLDDYGPARELANIVINSLLSPLVKEDVYLGDSHVLSGIDYVQLSPEITKLRGVAAATTKAMVAELKEPPPRPAPVRGILISFGGNPHSKPVAMVLEALSAAAFTGRIVVMPEVVSPFLPPPGLDVEMRPGGPDFHSILAAVDLAVLGGGLSLYEAAFLGVPVLAVAIPSASPGHEDHQWDTISKLEAAGCCRNLGRASQLIQSDIEQVISEVLHEQSQRVSMAQAGVALVDGRGLDRAVDLLISLSGAFQNPPLNQS